MLNRRPPLETSSEIRMKVVTAVARVVLVMRAIGKRQGLVEVRHRAIVASLWCRTRVN